MRNNHKIKHNKLSKTGLSDKDIFYVDFRKIGEYEEIRKDEDLIKVLKKILRYGYKGHPLAIIHKENNKGLKVSNNLLETNKYGDIGVIDGHHRLNALKILDTLGLLKSKLVPVQVIPVDTKNIIIKTKNPQVAPIELKQIRSVFSNKGKYIERNGSHFRFINQGTSVKLRKAQPILIITKTEFLKTDQIEKLKKNFKISKKQEKFINTIISIKKVKAVFLH